MSGDRTWVFVVAALTAASGYYVLGRRAPRWLPSPPAPELPAIVLVNKDAAPSESGPVPVQLRGPRMWFNVGLYFTRAPAQSPVALARSTTFRVVAQMPDPPPVDAVVEVRALSIDKRPPPSLQTLSYFGHHLTESEKGELQKATALTGIAFDAPVSVSALPEAMRVVADVAAKTSAFIVDLDTRQVYSVKEWKLRAASFANGVPEVDSHITIHAYRNGPLFRLVTLGMNKFALPELAVEQVAGNDTKVMGFLVNLVAQTLVERGRLDAPGRLVVSIDDIKGGQLRARLSSVLRKGAHKKANVQLAVAAPKEGDAANTVIEIAFPGAPLNLQQRQTALLAELFGSSDDAVQINDDDPELIAARKRAKASLLAKVKPRWKLSLPPELETLTVKAPFATTNGKNEWMWVEVVAWTGSKMAGVLQNDPFEVPGLAAGARVEVEESSIYDYVVTKNDGTTEGGETTAVILKQQQK